MQRRRLGLCLAIIAFAALVAIKPPVGYLRLSFDTATESGAPQVEAAVEIGAVAVTILFQQAERRLR
ncbi:hypothetical protein COC42_04845 [Sphingomonas spermidinifaciens]|uniref:Uncharacterized protein n=1 Tax=Sphingomonas spermidinifaciens TaxID=1141889 RepID=A0A2A4B7R5_9SPHN|nr:hypothetical protein [Sphingomonas spermidinifaciens]PCD03684.1 hypothetical protein COC42_04845 [Sphingomonas spermidinifaciens]